jgi:hypothetical protein
MSIKRVTKPDEHDPWKVKHCSHPEHLPPSHIVLPPGNYVHTCPGCKQEVPYVVPEVRW